MKFFPNTSKRSHKTELMDALEFQEAELAHILEDLDEVNKLLGGFKITTEGIEKILASACFVQPVRIIDVGCGNGSMLKHVARMGRRKGIKMKLKGVDVNPKAINIARENTQQFPEIVYEVLDLSTHTRERLGKVDILMCTLTLHHFKDEVILGLMKDFVESCSMGMVVNDLQRSKTAYFLFKIFSTFFLKNPIAKQDGKTSILRAFKKRDLETYGRHLQVRKQMITWKWAFRYQWIILK